MNKCGWFMNDMDFIRHVNVVIIKLYQKYPSVIYWIGQYLSHMTRGHRTQRTCRYEYSTRDMLTPEIGHGGHVIYIYYKNYMF
jgi:hypothetical protein